MEDSKRSPFLGDHSEEEFDNLMKDYRIYSKLIEDLDQNISKVSFSEPTSIKNIEEAFKEIQEKIKKINSQIKYLKNFIKDNQPKKYKKLCSISDIVINKYSKINVKFQEVLKRENATIQQEIDNTNNLEVFKTGNVREQMLVNKNNPRLENLLEMQKEYQIIYQITQDLTQITNEMKDSTERQSRAVNSISDSIIDVNDNANKANEEVKGIKKKDNTKINCGYILFGAVLVIAFCAICAYLYFWVYG